MCVYVSAWERMVGHNAKPDILTPVSSSRSFKNLRATAYIHNFQANFQLGQGSEFTGVCGRRKEKTVPPCSRELPNIPLKQKQKPKPQKSTSSKQQEQHWLEMLNPWRVHEYWGQKSRKHCLQSFTVDQLVSTRNPAQHRLFPVAQF